MYEVIQRQSLSKFTEFIAFFRANKGIKTAPVFDLLRGFVNLCHQRLLLLAVIRILLNLLANFALTFGVFL